MGIGESGFASSLYVIYSELNRHGISRKRENAERYVVTIVINVITVNIDSMTVMASLARRSWPLSAPSQSERPAAESNDRKLQCFVKLFSANKLFVSNLR